MDLFKFMDGFEQNFMGKVANHPRTIPLNFGGDPNYETLITLNMSLRENNKS